MILHIAGLLTPDDVRQCREALSEASWSDGRATAGDQSALAKRNLQISDAAPETAALRTLILARLRANDRFMSAALPARVFPPMFNRYDTGMGFGDHIDNALRFAEEAGGFCRTDLSCTLFLSDPEAYDGGGLVIGPGGAPMRLPAGDLLLYPGGTVHRVEPVTRGSRLASFFWVQSMVRDADRRTLLHDLDQAIALARRDLTDRHAAAVSLTGAYHNLVRMWADV